MTNKWKFHISPGTYLFADVLVVLLIIHVINYHLAVFVHGTNHPMIEIERTILTDQAEMIGRKLGELINKSFIFLMILFKEFQGRQGPIYHLFDIAGITAFSKSCHIFCGKTF